MLRPTGLDHPRDPQPSVAPPEAVPGGRAADAVGPRIRPPFRRIQYFSDLIVEGYRAALGEGPPATTLRTERVALGIDLPELDAVPLWSVREDGAVAIPFIEFLLEQVRRSVEEAVRAAAGAGARARLEPLVAALDRLRDDAGLEPGVATDLPRLSDVFVPQACLEELCRQGGLLDRITGVCDEAAAGARADA